LQEFAHVKPSNGNGMMIARRQAYGIHIRLAGGWCLVLVCYERRVLLVAGLFWEKSTAGWWLISQANRITWGLPRTWLETYCKAFFGFCYDDQHKKVVASHALPQSRPGWPPACACTRAPP
jgi:hypothetical protein